MFTVLMSHRRFEVKNWPNHALAIALWFHAGRQSRGVGGPCRSVALDAL